MTMKKRIKTAGALTLAAITVLSAAGLYSVYGALGVETDEKCSLTFTLDDTEFDELRSLEIPVDVYKVADITEEAVYDTAKYTDFDDLGLEKVSSTTTAEEWAQMAEDAMKIVEDKKIAPTADVKVTKPAGAAESTGVINNLRPVCIWYRPKPCRPVSTPMILPRTWYLFRITIIPKRTRTIPGYTM